MMFQSARIKLTAYYLLIIMTVSLLFSLAVYRGLTLEISRGLRIQALRILPREDVPSGELDRELRPSFLFGITTSPEPANLPANLHQQVFEEARGRIALQLALINLGILILSGGAGYFLAGKTLKPIAEMVEEQRRFVADASHELRTPLTAIKTETEVTLRDKNLDLESAKQLIVSNLEEIDKLKSLTDYFLTLSRYQNSGTPLTFEAFDLSPAVEEVINRLEGLAKEKQITIVKNLNAFPIEANRISIMELITILVDNAIKYTHEKGTVTIATEAKHDHALIKVDDEGIGIKASDLPYIFNRFYRADSSRTKNVVKGYGLGLSIAKSIVELHQGKISVISAVDQGTTFTVELPLKPKRKPV